MDSIPATEPMVAPVTNSRWKGPVATEPEPEEMSVHSTNDSRLPGHHTVPSGPDYRFSWPIYNETDFSRLGNWHEWLGFFEYPHATTDFAGSTIPLRTRE